MLGHQRSAGVPINETSHLNDSSPIPPEKFLKIKIIHLNTTPKDSIYEKGTLRRNQS
jgi:hypothetical protein